MEEQCMKCIGVFYDFSCEQLSFCSTHWVALMHCRGGEEAHRSAVYFVGEDQHKVLLAEGVISWQSPLSSACRLLLLYFFLLAPPPSLHFF